MLNSSNACQRVEQEDMHNKNRSTRSHVRAHAWLSVSVSLVGVREDIGIQLSCDRMTEKRHTDTAEKNVPTLIFKMMQDEEWPENWHMKWEIDGGSETKEWRGGEEGGKKRRNGPRSQKYQNHWPQAFQRGEHR